MKVVGATTPYTGTASNVTVRIPTNLKTTVTDSTKDVVENKKISDLNEVSISSGNFNIILDDSKGASQTLPFVVDSTDTMGDNVTAWNKVVTDYNTAHAGATVDLSFSITADGKLQISSSETLEFEPIDTNIFAETRLSPTQLTSKSLNQSAIIQDLLDYNDPDGIAVSSVTIIDENGILSCSYSDGSNLTTQINNLGQAEWRFTTPDGTIITGSDVTPKGSINVNSNMIIELASFINEEGLVSVNNNLGEWGPDAGEVFYGMAGEMAFGTLESGGYEGSNVDIAIELSNMIAAQRLIQMNSRVFSTASSVMETLAYLGQ